MQVANKRFNTLAHNYEIIFEKDAEIEEANDQKEEIPLNRKYVCSLDD